MFIPSRISLSFTMLGWHLEGSGSQINFLASLLAAQPLQVFSFKR